MDVDRFIEILGEEGITERMARKLWDKWPADVLLDEEVIRLTCRNMPPDPYRVVEEAGLNIDKLLVLKDKYRREHRRYK